MTVTLGIDTGGTYTDAVLVDHATGAVRAAAKALTTPRDLSVGIGDAIAAVLAAGESGPEEIALVSLSTTLATNAIAEGKGSPVCLLLIGYDPDLMAQYGFEEQLPTADVVYLPGGHDVVGDEVAALDEAATRKAIQAHQDRVAAFAVSGYFSVRNPAHELEVRGWVRELADRPVTCGHELSSRLNAVRRATTVALNARLIPLLQELVQTVQWTLGELGIEAPLMVVKGDGSLVRAEWAMARPIETILSGPAASAVGAWHLAGRGDVWVVDVGGTTTDIAALRDGRPRLNPEGARVGVWQTMVEAADVSTAGLGGDSHVTLEEGGRLKIGPRRVIPLALLAQEYPAVLEELRRMAAEKASDPLAGQFLLAQVRPDHDLPEQDRELLHDLAQDPWSLPAVLERLVYRSLALRRIEDLEARRLVMRAGFTPTDALHVLGRFVAWEGAASKLGASLLAEAAAMPVEAFCRQVVTGLSDRVTTALVGKVLADEGDAPHWKAEPAAQALLDRGLGLVPDSDLFCSLQLRQPIVAVGAPVAAYMPRVASQLHTELLIPDHAGVANAVGAVAGGVVQQLRAVIHPLEAERHFRLHLPDGVQDFGSLEEAVAHALRVLPERLREMARQAGAEQIEIQFDRLDQRAPVAGGWGGELYLSTELTFTAVGRPRMAE